MKLLPSQAKVTRMRSPLLIFAVLALTVYGQLMIKMRALVHTPTEMRDGGNWQYLMKMFSDIGVLSGLAAAVLAGVCWMLAIQRLEVGYAYPFVALSFVLVPLGSRMLFGE